MANKLTQIKRLLNERRISISDRILSKIEARGFDVADIQKAIRNAKECAKLTDDPTHDRYVILGGTAVDGTPVECVVTVRQQYIIVKSLYEI